MQSCGLVSVCLFVFCFCFILFIFLKSSVYTGTAVVHLMNVLWPQNVQNPD